MKWDILLLIVAAIVLLALVFCIDAYSLSVALAYYA